MAYNSEKSKLLLLISIIFELIINISRIINRPEKEGYKWTDQNTLIYLDPYQKYREQVGSPKMKKIKRM